MANLRAGLVGLGAMGRNHARVLGELEGVTLVGIADPVVAAAGSRSDVVATVEELIARGLDYCVVSAPTAHHEDIGLLLAEAGVPALIEKPLAVTPESAERLVAAFESRQLVGAVGHIERHNPAVRQARLRIADGLIGDVLQVATRRQGPFPARIADVGVVKDLATHDIDMTAWIAGSAYDMVMAQTAHRAGRAHEDMVSVAGILADGTVVSHLVNWLSPFKERVAVVTGERGALIVNTLTSDLTFHANGVVATEWDSIAQFRGVSEGDVIRYAFARPEPLRVEHEQFRNAVLGLENTSVTLREGLRTVAVATAILDSAAASAAVRISPAG